MARGGIVAAWAGELPSSCLSVSTRPVKRALGAPVPRPCFGGCLETQAAAAGGICRSRPALCPAPGRGWAGRSGTGSQSSLVVLLFKPRAAAGLSLSSPGVPKACAPLCRGGLCECRPHRTAGGTMSDLPSRGAGPKAWPLLVPVKQDQCERGLPGAGRVRPGSWPQRPGLQRLSK